VACSHDSNSKEGYQDELNPCETSLTSLECQLRTGALSFRKDQIIHFEHIQHVRSRRPSWHNWNLGCCLPRHRRSAGILPASSSVKGLRQKESKHSLSWITLVTPSYLAAYGSQVYDSTRKSKCPTSLTHRGCRASSHSQTQVDLGHADRPPTG
jgi:hypothetical protein